MAEPRAPPLPPHSRQAATLASVGTTSVVCFLALSPVMCSRLASFCAVVLSDEVSARDCRHATRRSPVYCAHETTKQQLNNSCAGLVAFAPRCTASASASAASTLAFHSGMERVSFSEIASHESGSFTACSWCRRRARIFICTGALQRSSCRPPFSQL